MKILFTGYHNPHFVSITEYIERAIERLGHELIAFDDRSFLIPGRIRQRFKFLQDWDLKRLNTNLVSLASRLKPDICLVSGGHRILPQTLERISKIGTLTVLWTVDFPHDFEPIKRAASFYDYIFCGGTEAQVLLQESVIKKTYWLPFACDSGLHRPVELARVDRDNYANDLVFVGSYYPNREAVLREITDFDLGIWGPSWHKLASDPGVREKIKGGKVKPAEWVKIFNAAKIIIIVHYKDGKVLDFQASPKVYEALSCGGFVLVNNQKDLTALFEDKKHLVVFKDIDDLRAKIKYYLDNPRERKRISENGKNYVVENHTYVQRIKRLLSVIKGEDAKS